MNNHRIYLSPPHLCGRESQRLMQVLDSNWVAPVGPELEEFESRMAARISVDHALAVSSGTAALHLALRCLDLQEDEEVLCSTLTFCASANPIAYERAKPVFIDSDNVSWNLDPNLLEEELRSCARKKKLPRAIIVVDVFGQSADMDAIGAIAESYEIPVIEDAAEALGAEYRGKPAGSSAWASFFSFNGNKIITTGGGGMLCSNDEDFVAKASHLSTQARDPAPHYQHSSIGYNYRMSNLLASVGLAQLEVLDDYVEARRQVFNFYSEALCSYPGISFMPEANYGKSSRWLTVMLVDEVKFGCSAEEIRQRLEAANIEARPVWKPLHLQPVFDHCRSRGGEVAVNLFRTGLCLPSGSAMSEDQLRRVTRAIQSCFVSGRDSRRGWTVEAA